MVPFLATSFVCSSFPPSWICVSLALSSWTLVQMKGVNINAWAALVLSEGMVPRPHLQQTLFRTAEAWDPPLRSLDSFLHPFPPPPNLILLSYPRFPSHFVSQQPLRNLEHFPLPVTGSKNRKGPPRSLSFRLCPKADLCSHRLRQMDVVSIQEIFIAHPGWAKPCAQDR